MVGVKRIERFFGDVVTEVKTNIDSLVGNWNDCAFFLVSLSIMIRNKAQAGLQSINNVRVGLLRSSLFFSSGRDQVF